MSPLLIVALAVLGHLQLSQASVCDPGWEPYGDSCYKLFAEKRSFDSSGETCTTIHNALLTSILDEDEMGFALYLINRDGDGSRTWIGLRVFTPVSDEVWVDGGSDLKPTPYRPWSGALSSGCAIVKANAWEIEDCDNKAYYLCRKENNCEDPCPVGQVLQEDGNCTCPDGMEMVDGECVDPCEAPLVRLPDGTCGCGCICRDGWSFYLDSCYKVFTDRKRFDGSGESCTVDYNALLTSILSPNEMDFVMMLITLAGENRAWVGARKFSTSADHVNVDTRDQPTAYTGWATDPLALTDDGCSMAKAGAIELTDCYDKAAYVCRYYCI